jgi:hypothetical protein
MTRATILAMAIAFGGGVFLGGCKSGEEKICSHMKSLYEKKKDKPLSEKKYKRCLERVKRKLSKCSNQSEVVSCFTSMESLRGERKCRKLCKKK